MNYFINESNLQNEKFPSLSLNNLKTKTISFICVWLSGFIHRSHTTAPFNSVFAI